MRQVGCTLIRRLHNAARCRQPEGALPMRPLDTASLPDVATALEYVRPFLYTGRHGGWAGIRTVYSIQYKRRVPEFLLANAPRLARLSVSHRGNWFVWLQAGSYEQVEFMPSEEYVVDMNEDTFPSYFTHSASAETAAALTLSHLAGFERAETRRAAALVRLASTNGSGFTRPLALALRDRDRLPWSVYADWCSENAPKLECYARDVAEALPLPDDVVSNSTG